MKIGIIGGGAAGLASAWLLEESHEVFLFEQHERLGGHAQTIYISPEHEEKIPIEIGFEFFDATLFPHFTRLLQLLKVKVATYPLTYTFYTADERYKILLPPLRGYKGLLNCSYHGMTLLQFWHVIIFGKKFIRQKNIHATLEEVVGNLWLTQEFKNKFLYPFLSAGWGAPIDDFKKFAAYDIFKWIHRTSSHCKPELWNEIIEGTSAYIRALAKELTTTQLYTSTPITIITYHEKKYTIMAGSKAYVVDKLIFATNPQNAYELLSRNKVGVHAQPILKNFESFPTLVAVHGDRRFMPRNESDWSVTNVCYDGTASAMTIYKPWKSKEKPYFRSWITRDILPEPLYALQKFEHQKVTPAYFKAQQELAKVQGTENIWFAGLYTYDIDSHENAIVSALKLAQQLAPESKRLKLLSNANSTN